MSAVPATSTTAANDLPTSVEAILGSSTLPSAVATGSGTILWSNSAFRERFGVSTAEDPQSAAGGQALMDPAFLQALRQVCEETTPASVVRRTVVRVMTPAGQGKSIPADLIVSAIDPSAIDPTDPAGSTTIALLQVVERSAVQDAGSPMALSTDRALAENTLDVIVLVDAAGRVLWASPSAVAVLGQLPEALEGRTLSALLPKDDHDHDILAELLRPDRQALNGARSVVRLRSPSGDLRYVSVSARPHAANVDRQVIALGMRDVTDEFIAKRELTRMEEQFLQAMLGAPEGIGVADADDLIVQVNPALCQLLGRSPAALIGRQLRNLIPEGQRDQADKWRERLLTGSAGVERLQHPMITPHGEVWVDHSIAIMRDDLGEPEMFVHQFADRTAAHNHEVELSYRASHDSQTGLANRDSLMTRLGQRLGAPPPATESVGVLLADIDDLKPINDRHGHPVGDEVIAAVADRLRTAVRRKDVVARIGGDEFAILLQTCSTTVELEVVARNVQRAASGPLSTQVGEIAVSVSVGAVLADSRADTDMTLASVDAALYQAKRAGRNQVAIRHIPIEG